MKKPFISLATGLVAAVLSLPLAAQPGPGRGPMMKPDCSKVAEDKRALCEKEIAYREDMRKDREAHRKEMSAEREKMRGEREARRAEQKAAMAQAQAACKDKAGPDRKTCLREQMGGAPGEQKKQ